MLARLDKGQGPRGNDVPLRSSGSIPYRTDRSIGYTVVARQLTEHGSVRRIGEEAQSQGMTSVLVLSTESMRPATSLVVSSLDARHIRHEEFFLPRGEANETTFHEAMKKLRSDANGVIGIGGGSVLDTAKAVAIVARNGTLETAAKGVVHEQPLNLILAPSTAGTGSEATTVSVVLKPKEGKYVMYDMGLLPSVAVLDPELTRTLQGDILKYPAMDALCHAIEASMSLNASQESAREALGAIRTINRTLSRALFDHTDAEARADLGMAAHRAGEAMINSGRIDEGCLISGAGLTHAIGLAVGGIYPFSHGLTVGMVLPHAMEALKDRFNDRLELVGEVLDVGSSADAAIRRVQDLMDRNQVEKTISYAIRRHGLKSYKEPDPKLIVQRSLLAADRLLVNFFTDKNGNRVDKISGTEIMPSVEKVVWGIVEKIVG